MLSIDINIKEYKYANSYYRHTVINRKDVLYIYTFIYIMNISTCINLDSEIRSIYIS